MDRLSPLFGIKLGFFLNFASSALLILYKNLFGVITSQLIGGLGFLLIVVGAQTLISSNTDFTEKAKGFGDLALFGSIGQGIGPYLGGIIVKYYSFELLFLITILFSLPGIFLRHDEKKGILSNPDKNISLFKEIHNILHNTNLILILLFTSIAVFITTLRSSFLPIFLKNNNYEPDIIGILISIFSITMSVLRIFISRIFKVIDLNKLLYLTLFLFSIGLLIIPLRNDLITIAIGISLWGLGFGISQPLSMLLISENIQEDKSGLGMGIRFTAITTSAFIAPIIFGLITEYLDIKYDFYLSSVICLLFIVTLITYDFRKSPK
ncbi:hypothetical protein JCM13304A_13670 [Desulfothermus okinawensis JCM 13304]